MLFIMYLKKTAEGCPFQLALGQRHPLENEVARFYSLVHVFEDAPPESMREEVFSKAFMLMQAEAWSQHGQKNELLKRQGLAHTSMSPGDMIYDSVAKKLFICENVGWSEVFLTAPDSDELLSGEELECTLPFKSLLDDFPVDRLFNRDWLGIDCTRIMPEEADLQSVVLMRSAGISAEDMTGLVYEE